MMHCHRTSIGLLLCAFIAGCGDSSGTANNTQTERLQTEPRSEKVVRRDVVGYELLAGTIYTPPNAEAVVYAPYNAPVERVLTSVGQRVRRGEVLIELSLPDQDASYEQARAAVQAAEAAHASANAQYGGAVREAQRVLRDARATERTIRSQTDPGGDASALQEARANREAAEESVRQAQAQFRTDMLTYQQQLDAARATLAAARSGKRQGAVTAPISGTVLELKAQTGQEVGRAQKEVLARIVNLAAIEVKATVAPEQVSLVKPRTPVVILIEGMPDKPFDGSVSEIRTLPAENGVVRHEATIDFNNDNGDIKPGMRIRAVGVRIGLARDTLAVPSDAIQQDESGKPYVKVLDGANWKVVIVEPGLSDGFYTAVKDGSVKEGDTVQVLPKG
jgi:multidrug efflux pump subunit AcrA (membrane-fusion protein)